MDFQDDAAEFSSEDVDTIVKNAITGCLTDVMYNPKKVSMAKTIRSLVDDRKRVASPRDMCYVQCLVRAAYATHVHAAPKASLE